jgi:hypothetical protein
LELHLGAVALASQPVTSATASPARVKVLAAGATVTASNAVFVSITGPSYPVF